MTDAQRPGPDEDLPQPADAPHMLPTSLTSGTSRGVRAEGGAGPDQATGTTPWAPGDWLPELRKLCSEIRGPVRSGLRAVAHSGGGRDRDSVSRIVGLGAGDTTFAIDEVAERAVDGWFRRVAAVRPLSLLTEDAGWRHLGPGAAPGDISELSGFDHGGPRIALDPIDGTRNIMHDLRSAWVVVSCAGPGRGEPRFADLVIGINSELPDTRTEVARELSAIRGEGAHLRELVLPDGAVRFEAACVVDGDDRLDRGYFPFFHYHASTRPEVQALARDVVERVAKAHEIDTFTIYDDQYISSGGQLALLSLGHYRGMVDARGAVDAITGITTQTAKPYDVAGALFVAAEAGCPVTAPDGRPLDFPLDAETPVDFAAFHNGATRDGWMPHLIDALAARQASGHGA